MIRKNLTVAVLAGLAGIAGIAGTAQAVNLNPDGVGQVLIYPYYTSNDGNQTILSVVNTTDDAKAVKVRFLEGYNSREVLDFNLYLSAYDVWVAAIADDGGTPTLYIPDSSCTVPYLYGLGVDAGLDMGVQEFLHYAYSGSNTDGGPTDIARAAEGHIEMIEMGTLTDDSFRAADLSPGGLPKRVGSATAATHVLIDGSSQPYDCEQLVRNWTNYGVGTLLRDDPLDGMWFDQAIGNDACDDPIKPVSSDCKTKGHDDIVRNSGGLFGSAAVINAANGTMFSYDPKAIQGFDKSSGGMHFIPGTIHPSLGDGDQTAATIFFGTPSNKAITLSYGLSVDAVSALFMHDNVMNEYTIQADLNAATEWILTFPTKSFYVDADIVGNTTLYTPNPADEVGCNGWDPGEAFEPWDGKAGTKDPDWEQCEYLKTVFGKYRLPFTETFDGEACEVVYYDNWDREESTTASSTPGDDGPVVSPAPPGPSAPPGTAPFELCYEVNVLRFGDEDIFGTTSDLLYTVSNTPDNGWANISFSDVVDLSKTTTKDLVELHQDVNGLVGLPVVGFAAMEFENGFLEGGSVLANYGGLFGHKASVRRISPDECYHSGSSRGCLEE